MWCIEDAAGVETLLRDDGCDGPGRLPVPLETETRFEGTRTIFFSDLAESR